jgi:adenosylcobyric acid synthase
VCGTRQPRPSHPPEVDALGGEPGVPVAVDDRPADIERADLAVLPATKATVTDLAWRRARGLDVALADRARRGAPILAVCGGYQMLGGCIDDPIESGAGRVDGLGLLPVATTFAPEKVLACRRGTCGELGGAGATGYEIRHGRVAVAGGRPLLTTDDGTAEGCVVDAVIGTSWHGLLESDALRHALLVWVAERTGRYFVPGVVSFADVREARLDALGDLVADHLDSASVDALLADGAPAGLPVVPPAGAPTP